MQTDSDRSAAIGKAAIFKCIEEQRGACASTAEKQFPAQIATVSGSKCFVWDTTNSNLLCQNLDTEGQTVQTIVPTHPPYFDVHNIELSPEGTFMVVYGKDGVAVVELPDHITTTIRMRNATKSVGTKSFFLGEKIFLRNPSLQVMQVKWHPGSPTDSHVSVLTSDSYIRTYDILHLDKAPIAVAVGRKAGCSSGTFPTLRSLGEVAAAFDFGPALVDADGGTDVHWLWPVFILFGNGGVYSFYSSVQNRETHSEVRGPMPMRPQTEDNYEGTYCDILCLPSQPVTLALATSDLTVYHCMILSDSDEDEEIGPEGGTAQFQLQRWSSRQSEMTETIDSSSVSYLHVFERVTLSTDVGVNPDDTLDDEEFTVRFFRDRFSKFRYFVSHMSGIHCVCLPSLIQLTQSLQAEEEPDFTILQVPSTVEFMLCTQISGQEPAAPLALVRLENFLTSLLAITRDCRAQMLPISLSLQIGRPEAPMVDLPDISAMGKAENDVNFFSERIKQLLQKKAMQPRLHLSEDDALTLDAQIQLLTRSRDIFRKEYISRLSLASEEVERRAELLRNRLLGLKQELTLIECTKQELQTEAELIAEQYEDLKEKQETFEKRLRRLYGVVQQCSAGISQSDTEMKRRLLAYEADLPKIQGELGKLRNVLARSVVRGVVPSSRPKLTDAQASSIKETLQTQSVEIREVMAKMAEQAEKLSALESTY